MQKKKGDSKINLPIHINSVQRLIQMRKMCPPAVQILFKTYISKINLQKYIPIMLRFTLACYFPSTSPILQPNHGQVFGHLDPTPEWHQL